MRQRLFLRCKMASRPVEPTPSVAFGDISPLRQGRKLLSIHPPDQKQRDRREDSQDRRAHDVADNEGDDTAIGGGDRRFRHRVDDEQVHPHGRRDEADLDHDQHQYAEPDRQFLLGQAEIERDDFEGLL